MAISQHSSSCHPGTFGVRHEKTAHSRHSHRTISVTRLVATLSATLILGTFAEFAQANTDDPIMPSGSYLVSEKIPQSGPDLSVTVLPDPALALLQTPYKTRKNESGLTSWSNGSAWITDIGTSLYHDSDNDGYHSGLSLTIDADTSMNMIDVYLSIDLQRYSGPRERLHTSNDFSLYGRSLTDEYQIDIELLQNYPADDYDLYIELHDAYDGRVLDHVSAEDFSNLYSLPLESEDWDSNYDPRPLQPSFPPANDDIHVEEYAGSAGFISLLCLSLTLWARRKRHTDQPFRATLISSKFR